MYSQEKSNKSMNVGQKFKQIENWISLPTPQSPALTFCCLFLRGQHQHRLLTLLSFVAHEMFAS